MSRVRSVLATLLLCGFAVLGVFMLVLALLAFGLPTGSSSLGGAVVDAFGAMLLGGALLLSVPALAALLLKPRRPVVASAVASMLGLGVFAATAAQATSDAGLLALNLAGLGLVLCVLPLPADRIDGEPR